MRITRALRSSAVVLGVATAATADHLNLESKHITDLQTKQPGRLAQTLAQASAQMFERLPADRRVDSYVKGPMVGLVLDAHIRHLTNDRKSLDDVMRRAHLAAFTGHSR